MVFTPNDPTQTPGASSPFSTSQASPSPVRLTREEVFQIWAPTSSVWSAWTKPVIFAQAKPGQAFTPPSTDPRLIDASWAPMNTEHTALVLDLQADESVQLGLALAMRGFRPIPLYNSTDNAGAIIPIASIVSALYTGASTLQALNLDSAAPPVFLLDANRLGNFRPSPGQFDNRWVVFPQDFPSGTFLRSQGITRVLLVKRGGTTPQNDLRRVMGMWSKSGIELLAKDLGGPGVAAPVVMRGGSRLWMWSSIMMWSSFGLRRSSAGGFGSRVPIPSSSTG